MRLKGTSCGMRRSPTCSGSATGGSGSPTICWGTCWLGWASQRPPVRPDCTLSSAKRCRRTTAPPCSSQASWSNEQWPSGDWETAWLMCFSCADMDADFAVNISRESCHGMLPVTVQAVRHACSSLDCPLDLSDASEWIAEIERI